MPFQFLSYLQPTSYFRRLKNSGNSQYPKVEALPKKELSYLKEDASYEHPMSVAYDLSWQAVQGGYVGDAETYREFQALPVIDNYRFARKNFHPAWVFYVLMLRLVSLHNPVKEIGSWWNTRNVTRSGIKQVPDLYKDWDGYQSGLLTQRPLVSVVIPTLNRYGYLKDVLNDFELQDYKNFEVIVVDQSDAFDIGFYDQFDLNIHVIQQKEKALWLARNIAVKQAKGTLVALSEDDVRIQPDWISSHIRCLDYFAADVSAGVFYPEGKSMPKERSFFAVASQFATGNAMLYKEVFKKVGLFDRQFEKQRMGDGEFGMRIYLSGFRSVSNPYASCVDVKAGVGGLRDMGSWDAFRPSSFFAPRPIPSVIYFYRRYFGDKATRLALLKTVPISLFPYQLKKNRPLLLVAALLSIVICPIILLQVLASWRLANKMLKQGPIIEIFE